MEKLINSSSPYDARINKGGIIKIECLVVEKVISSDKTIPIKTNKKNIQ